MAVSLVAFNASAAITFSFQAVDPDPANTATYTFASMDFGAADSDRCLIVTFTGRKGGAATTISGVTIGGVTATEIVQYSNSDSNSDISGLYSAIVPTGTSGDVVVSLNDTLVRATGALYRAVGVDSCTTPYDFDSDGSADPTTSLNVPAGGFAVAAALSNSNSSATWTGLTEDFDGTLESFVTYTGASEEFVSEQVGLTITADFASSGTTPVAVFASWGPAADEVAQIYPAGKLNNGAIRINNGGLRVRSNPS